MGPVTILQIITLINIGEKGSCVSVSVLLLLVLVVTSMCDFLLLVLAVTSMCDFCLKNISLYMYTLIV